MFAARGEPAGDSADEPAALSPCAVGQVVRAAAAARPCGTGSLLLGDLEDGAEVTTDDAQDEGLAGIRIAKQRSDPQLPAAPDAVPRTWRRSHVYHYAPHAPMLTPALRLF
jgi:hypothetical protein